MADEKDLTQVFAALDNMLQSVDISDINAESNPSFITLPDGYYLAEVTSAKLRESSKGEPQVQLILKTIENGITMDGRGKLVEIPRTKNQSYGKYYTFKEDPKTLRQFVADMLKFEEGEDVPILPKEAFTTAATIADALDVLVGMQIYFQMTTSNPGKENESHWGNLVSWKAAKSIGLQV